MLLALLEVSAMLNMVNQDIPITNLSTSYGFSGWPLDWLSAAETLIHSFVLMRFNHCKFSFLAGPPQKNSETISPSSTAPANYWPICRRYLSYRIIWGTGENKIQDSPFEAGRIMFQSQINWVSNCCTLLFAEICRCHASIHQLCLLMSWTCLLEQSSVAQASCCIKLCSAKIFKLGS